VLSEEALVLLAVVGACALLILGIIELIWPSKPRHPVRRSPAPPATEAPPAVQSKPAAPPAAAPGPRRRRSKVSPHARRHAGTAVAAKPVAATGATAAWATHRPTPAPPAPVPSEIAAPAPPEAAPPEPARVEASAAPADPAAAPAPPAPPAPKPELDPLLVETCFSLYQERCYAEVIALGGEALAKVRAEVLTEDGRHDTAALRSVVALAKQALGDEDGARDALEAALAICPGAERPTYRQHLAALALSTAQAWLARAHSHETDDCVTALRAALAWVARGLEAVPADDRLHHAGVDARQALWPAYEQAVHKLLQRQEFEEARRLLREALDDPELPASRAGEFQELLSGTFGGEIGQLTAQAIRSMQEERESEALASLQRAEELLAAIPDEALPPKRREEVDQRLWWGYTRLGIRRVESGEYEAAIEPLVHALRFVAINPDRQAETRAALVRALEGVADVRTLAIRQLADGGNRDEAVLRTEALRELLRRCLELGVSEEDLSVPFARTRRLVEELGMEDRA
jgi:tetratricopeptide (TPR) repeat protein